MLNHVPTIYKKYGFSLLEILVSISILAVLMLLLFSFFDQATSAWQNTEKRVDAYREARAAFYYIKRDLQTMVVQSGISWLYYDDPETTPEISYTGAPRSPNSHGDAIFFISTQPPASQDPNENTSSQCAVGYYLAYSPDNSPSGAGISSYKLYRYFKSSDSTWNKSGPEGIFPHLSSNAPLFLPAQVTAGGDEIIARYVTDFFIRPMEINTAGNPQRMLVTDGTQSEKPAFLDIAMKAFSHSSAQKLRSQDDWHNPPGNLADQDPQQFHFRIAIP